MSKIQPNFSSISSHIPSKMQSFTCKKNVQLKTMVFSIYIFKLTYLMWGNMIIKKKRGGEQGWGEQQGGWGQPANNGGWGQQQQGGWGQQQGGWGQPQQPQQQQGGWGSQGGWGQAQQQQNTGGWGQQGGWGQPQQQQQGGWGQPQQQQGGWGQPQQQQGGWGQPQQQQGWGQQQGGWGQQGQQGQQQNTWGTGNIGFLNSGSAWGNQHEGAQWIQNQQQNNQASIINTEAFDIAKYLEQQITQVEPSPHTKKLEQLRKKGEKFNDDRFPPSVNSLCGEWGAVKQFKDVKWTKISEKIQNPKIFVGKPEPKDIKQGYLGDCYFLAGIAALSERPDRIFNLFLFQQKNELNYYSVKMLYKGKWMTIDMDEYIPFLYNSPAFSKSVDGELWVILLEKAWAKLYTSYKRIEAGYPEEPLHDLTGAPIKQIYIKKGNFNKEEQWNYLLMASQREYSMVCSSNPGSDSDTSQSGVVQGHAYTLLNAVYLNFQGQKIRLIQLRNPWGKGEYKGTWSDYDPNWKNVDPAEKQRIGYFEDKEDGIFFIPFETFWSEFRSITIAEIDDNASYLYKSYKDKQKQGCYFKVQIKKEGQYSLQVDKTPQRSFEDKLQNDYNYPTALVQVGILNNNNIQKLQTFQSNARTTQQKYNLKPGTYIVKVRIDFDPKWEKDFDVNLAVYAQYPCVITLASKQEATLLAGKAVNWTGVESESNSQTSWNNLGAFGFSSNQGFGNVNNVGEWNNSGSGWGSNNGGWGNTSGTGQQQQGGWGNPQQGGQQGGWGQQQGGWGQGSGSGQGGWNQPTQGGQQGGWGQSSGSGSGWNQPTQGGQQGGWGNNNGW